MVRLKRNECSVLKLVLKRKWYDMIASGEKKEEYRDSRKHWWTRIGRKTRRFTTKTGGNDDRE